MKKLLTGMLALLMGASVTMAQTPAASTAKAKKAQTEQKASAAGQHLKKDGTPDKRYKENKTTAATAGPKKKDGTPDMRYKANKKKS